MRKRVLGIVLAFAMLLSLAPAVWADEIRIVDGFEDGETPITVVDGAGAAEPEAAAGTLYVESSPAGADLYLDGTLYRPAVTPCEVPLGAGSHSLSIRMAGYDDYTATVHAGDRVSARLRATVPEGEGVRTLVVAWDDWGRPNAEIMTWENYDKFINRQEPDWDWDDPDYVYGAYDTFTHFGEAAIGVTLREAICIVMNDNGWYDEANRIRWHYVIEFWEGKDVYTQTGGINCFGRGTASWISGEELFIRYTWEGPVEDTEAKALWSQDGCFTINGDRDRDGTPDVTLEGWGAGPWDWDGRWNLNLTCSDAHVVGVNFAATMHVANSVPFWQPSNYFDLREIYITGCSFETTAGGPDRFFGTGGGGSLYGTAAAGYGLPGTYDLNGFYITGCTFEGCLMGIICAGGDMDYARVKNLVIQGNRLVNGEIFVRNVDAHTWYMWYNGNSEMSGLAYGDNCIGYGEYNVLEDVTISGNTVEYTAEAIPDLPYDSGYGSAVNIGNSNLGGSHNTVRNVTVRCNRTSLEQANIDAFQHWGNAGIGISNADVGDGPNAAYPAELASQLTQVSDNLFDGLTVEYNDFRINCFVLTNITFAGTAQVGTDNNFRNIQITNNRIATVKGLHILGASGTSNPGCVSSGALENLTVADNEISVLRKTGWSADSNINSSGEQDDYGILLCGASVANYETNWDEPGEQAPWDTLDADLRGVAIMRNRITGFANGLLINGAECGRTHYVTGIRVSDVTVSDNEIVTDGINKNCRNDGISLIGAIDGGTDCRLEGVTVSGNRVTACNGLLAAGFFYRGMSCRWGIRDNQVLGGTATGNSFIYQDPSGNGGFPILTADAVSGWFEIPYGLGRSAVELSASDNSAAGFAWGGMELSALSEPGVSNAARFLAAAQRCSDEATGGRYIDWYRIDPAEEEAPPLFMGVCDRPNYRPGNLHRFYLCPGPSAEPEAYTVTVDGSRVAEGVTTSLAAEERYFGETSFTVSAPDDRAVLVAVKNGEEYTALPCATVNGEHRFTLDVTNDVTLVLVYKGDADQNRAVTLRDSLAIKRHSAGTEPLEGLRLLTADADGDGKADLRDSLAIKKATAGTEAIAW